MANKVLAIFEKPIYHSFEPVDPHLFAVGLGIADTPVEVNVLLRDSAVTYAAKNQILKGPKIAGLDIQDFDTSPGKLIEFMVQNGGKVHVVEEDMKSRGLKSSDLVNGVTVVSENDSVSLIEEHEAIMVL
jgi:sulfur relay (sulfurtransferase) DsrF/TusC family protein